MSAAQPSRGEIWLVDLNPTRGHEQAGFRPGLVVSTDLFNQGPAGLVVLLPITRRDKRIPLHVEMVPPEGGLHAKSHIMCDHIRCVSKDRLARCVGSVSSRTLLEVEDRIRILLAL